MIVVCISETKDGIVYKKANLADISIGMIDQRSIAQAFIERWSHLRDEIVDDLFLFAYPIDFTAQTLLVLDHGAHLLSFGFIVPHQRGHLTADVGIELSVQHLRFASSFSAELDHFV